jgi:hypothetical protein
MRASAIVLILTASGCRGVLGIDDGHPIDNTDASAADGSSADTRDLDEFAPDSSVPETTAVDGRADTTLVDAISDTATLPPDTGADLGADTPTAFASTPGTVDCAGTTCDWVTPSNRSCCKNASGGGFSCLAPHVGCPLADQFMCDEKADCIAYGYGPTACCANPAGGTSACVASGCGTGPQLCMTNTECPSGKCAITTIGPGKAPHGACE